MTNHTSSTLSEPVVSLRVDVTEDGVETLASAAQWDGSLKSANTVISLINSSFRDEENPAELSHSGYPHIRIDVNNKIQYVSEGKWVVIDKNQKIRVQDSF